MSDPPWQPCDDPECKRTHGWEYTDGRPGLVSFPLDGTRRVHANFGSVPDHSDSHSTAMVTLPLAVVERVYREVIALPHPLGDNLAQAIEELYDCISKDFG